MKASVFSGLAATIALVIATSACGAVQDRASSPGQAVPASSQAAPSANPDYKLGTGDKLRITVFGEPNLTGEYAVTANGTVSFPLIGTIAAVGQTLDQVQESIRTKLSAGYLKDPRVAVEVLEYRTFYILGEVNKPGEYPYRTNLTVAQAVATAGGYTYRANRKRFAITHPGGPESRQLFKSTEQLRVEPGDTVTILERFF